MYKRKWSPTAFKKMGTCGRQYAYAYLTDEKGEEEPSIELALGSVVHKTVEAVHKDNLWAPKDWQRKYYELWHHEASQVPPGRYNKRAYENIGFKIVDNYVDTEPERGGKLLHSEYNFGDGDFTIGKHKITGIIDQIRELPNGDIWIIDMKSNKKEPDPLVLRHDAQFTMYAFVGYKLFGKWPRISWYHLRTGEMIETQRNEADILRLEEMLDEADQKVELKMFSRNVGYHCGWCPFKQDCLGNVEQNT